MAAEIAWIDLETTGLEPNHGHFPLQIAIVLTDENFEEIASIERKVYFREDFLKTLRSLSDEYVNAMHEKTGLWNAVVDETQATPLMKLEAELISWIQSYVPIEKVLILGGNSISLDREFLREFFPKIYRHLSYRSLDMTSVENFFTFTEGRAPFEKEWAHSALDDIRESIEQARYHKRLSIPF